jgi:predicted dehydrogenase
VGKIGAAVIGAGIYGQVHARNYQAHPDTELISIWSRSPERAKKIGQKYNCKYTNELERIANDERVQIVSIATPDFAHVEPALNMIASRKHILLEKPMAISVEHSEQIAAAYELQLNSDPKLKLMVNFHNRWYPPIAQAKRVIDRGDIGEPVSVYANLSDRIEVATEWLSWAGKSGPDWFLLPHTVDVVRWFLSNQKVKKVFAVGRKGVLQSKGVSCYDAIQAQVEFEKTIAVFETSWILPSSWRNVIEFRFDVLGSEGKIGINGDDEGLTISAKNYQTPFLYDTITENEPIKYFIDCVVNDKRPSCTVEDALEVTRIIEAIVESVKTGEVIN